jgi:hypothetical protein
MGDIRLAASRTLDATSGAGKAIVAMSLARSGIPAALPGALHDNDLGDATPAFLRLRPVGSLASRAIQRATRVPRKVM